VGKEKTFATRQQILDKQQLSYNSGGTIGNDVLYSVHAK
jgi:hypothetical protein